jgi:hypothetical protein
VEESESISGREYVALLAERNALREKIEELKNLYLCTLDEVEEHRRHTVDILAPIAKGYLTCIILYSASILSRLLEHQETIGDEQGAAATKKYPPSPGSTSIFLAATSFRSSRTHSIWT